MAAKKSSLLPLSKEDDDLLIRSSKKLKNGVKSVKIAVNKEEWPKLGENKSVFSKGGPSFAEKLKGKNGEGDSSDDDQDNSYDPAEDNMSEDEIEQEDSEPLCKIVDDPFRNFPTFSFSEKMKKRLYRAWRKAVIVKLLGKSIGYKALLSCLQFLWAKKGVVNLINIGYGFYVVKFTNREDFQHALTGGPWMIYDHYLTVRPWEPNFVPARAKINKVACWVRMPNVLLEYYDREALNIIGDKIGETIKVDINTSCQLRGHYARVCVLVNLEEQLMSGFRLDEEDYFLEYEGLHMLCRHCGIYGHVKETCPLCINKNGEAAEKRDGVGSASSGLKDQAKDDVPNAYRDLWRTVQKPRRQRKGKDVKNDHQKTEVRGSRFEVLAEEGESGGKEGENSEKGNVVVEVQGDSEQVVVVPRHTKQSNVVRPKKGKKDNPQQVIVMGATKGTHVITKGSDISQGSLKHVEKRGREVRSGELLMLTYGGEEKALVDNMEAQREESPEVVACDLQGGRVIHAQCGMDSAQMDLLDPGEVADTSMDQDLVASGVGFD